MTATSDPDLVMINRTLSRMARHEAYSARMPEAITAKRLPFGRGYVRMDLTDDPKLDVYDMAQALKTAAPIQAFDNLFSIIRYSGGLGRCHDVLTHSLRVAAYARNYAAAAGLSVHEQLQAEFYGLIHDLHETIIGDIPSPLKKAIPALDALESVAEAAMLQVFNIPTPPAHIQAIIGTADYDAFEYEYGDYFKRTAHRTPLRGYREMIKEAERIWSAFREVMKLRKVTITEFWTAS